VPVGMALECFSSTDYPYSTHQPHPGIPAPPRRSSASWSPWSLVRSPAERRAGRWHSLCRLPRDLGSTISVPTMVISIILWTTALSLPPGGRSSTSPGRCARDPSFPGDRRQRRAHGSLKANEERQRTLAEENRQLYQRQLDIAEKLQMSLLNTPSETALVRVGHLYRSATETARVAENSTTSSKCGAQRSRSSSAMWRARHPGSRTATLVKDAIHAFATCRQTPQGP